MEICPKCGLPSQACICEQMSKSAQPVKVTTEKKRYGKISTIVSGFDKSVDISKIAKSLKNELACGGTDKNEMIELQGDHLKKIKQTLERMGFEVEII